MQNVSQSVSLASEGEKCKWLGRRMDLSDGAYGEKQCGTRFAYKDTDENAVKVWQFRTTKKGK